LVIVVKGIENRVLFTGCVDDQTLQQYVANADAIWNKTTQQVIDIIEKM
jgi:hypothetical protein